jgi:hypothetical protein
MCRFYDVRISINFINLLRDITGKVIFIEQILSETEIIF